MAFRITVGVRTLGGGDFPAQADRAALDLRDVHVDAAGAREPVVARFPTGKRKPEHLQSAAFAGGARRAQLGVSKGLDGGHFTRLESEP